MSVIVTIKARIPNVISDVYQHQYILKQLQEVLDGQWIELPHPDGDVNSPMRVDVESITVNWVGGD